MTCMLEAVFLHNLLSQLLMLCGLDLQVVTCGNSPWNIDLLAGLHALLNVQRGLLSSSLCGPGPSLTVLPCIAVHCPAVRG
jgi:hypothetical protein